MGVRVEVFEMVDGCDVSAFATASQVVQHTATYCNTKQHTATQYNTKQHTGSTVGGCGISAYGTASQRVSTPVEYSKSRRLVEGVGMGSSTPKSTPAAVRIDVEGRWLFARGVYITE
mmetsp:Transcript_34698/g.50831  ORF Transcript_34698/g.50831 Transcript_34698/m.50831 type:complete len:117 (+) Transcript_34698:196-546(+)